MAYLSTAVETDQMPPGIPYIVGNEAAERFSFYGMRTILVVFMAQYLHWMDGKGGKVISNTEAVEYYHQFASWVYFTPLLGALLADIFLGKYRTILMLSVVYCLGHAALACMGSYGFSSQWLFGGLLLICLGAGGIKPCVSAHVGDQFGKGNHHLLTKIYNWFYFSINFGSFFSTLLTPWLLEWYGPHWAFGVPGVLMAIATVMFWIGRHKFVHIPAAGFGFFREAFSREGIIALCKLIPLFAIIAVFWSLYDQTGSSWVLQAEQMDLHFLGVHWLESQVQAVNPVLILVFIPLFTFVIYPLLNRVFPLTPLRKIGLGLVLMTLSFWMVTVTQGWIDAGQRPSIGWQILAYVVITASEILVSIVGLEFAYTQAPRTMKSMVMSLFWLSVWGGNQFTAQVNHAISVPSASSQQFEAAISSLPADWQTSPRNVVLPGYDGRPGTADDFIARCNEGNIESLEIPDRGLFLAAAARIEALAGAALPQSAKGREVLDGMKDSWGNPLLYDLIDSSHARISSAGPDQQRNTAWDLGVMIERGSANGPSSEHSWLSRRKHELGVAAVLKPVSGFTRTEFCGGQTKLEGAAYFRFFTWLVLGTAVLFIPFAMLYRPRAYLHD
jgi:proton-dependent oligopeptide transporter, POT family